MHYLGIAPILFVGGIAAVFCSSEESSPMTQPSEETTTGTTVPQTTTSDQPATTLDQQSTARALLNEWVAGWEAHDPERVAAVVTDGGKYINPIGQKAAGHDDMKAYVRAHSNINNVVLGETTETDAGTFVAPLRFKVAGMDGSGERELEMEGKLAARIEFLSFSGFQ